MAPNLTSVLLHDMMEKCAEVAQSVEHSTENASVASSILALSTQNQKPLFHGFFFFVETLFFHAGSDFFTIPFANFSHKYCIISQEGAITQRLGSVSKIFDEQIQFNNVNAYSKQILKKFYPKGRLAQIWRN